MHDIFDLGDMFELLSLVWDIVELIIRLTARMIRWMTTQTMREGTRTIYVKKRAFGTGVRDRFFSPTKRQRAGWRKAYAVR